MGMMGMTGLGWIEIEIWFALFKYCKDSRIAPWGKRKISDRFGGGGYARDGAMREMGLYANLYSNTQDGAGLCTWAHFGVIQNYDWLPFYS